MQIPIGNNLFAKNTAKTCVIFKISKIDSSPKTL